MKKYLTADMAELILRIMIPILAGAVAVLLVLASG